MWCRAIPTRVASSPALLAGLPNPRQRGDAIGRLLLGIHSTSVYDAVDCGQRRGRAKATGGDMGGCHPCHERVACRSCRAKPLGAQVDFPHWLHDCLQDGKPDLRATVATVAEWKRAQELGIALFVENMVEGEVPIDVRWDQAMLGAQPDSSRAEAEAEAEAAADAVAAAAAGSSRDGEISLDLLKAYAFGGADAY